MNESIFNGFGIVLLAACGWFGGQALLATLVSRHRRDLRDGVAYLKANANLNPFEVEAVDHLVSTSAAVRSSLMLSLAYLTVLVMPKPSVLRERDLAKRQAPALFRDPKFDDLMDWYFVSAFAANPLFGCLAIVLRIAWRARASLILRSINDQDHLFALPSLEAAQRG